jgi:ketosteroid isomerase-like protein
MLQTDNTSEIIKGRIISMEKAALDRWKTGDTFGFVEIASDDITYFDPFLEKRVTGIKEFTDHYASFRYSFNFPGYELLNPEVQLYGDTAVLTFNFEGTANDGSKNRWNATEVYHKFDNNWKLIHSHWSITKTEPE